MSQLTVIYATARQEPHFQWFLDSLWRQCDTNDLPQIVIVDFHHADRSDLFTPVAHAGIIHVPPKPTIWQGEHRLTDRDYWAMSSARNTGIALAKTDWIAFVDDRCVLSPTWMEGMKEAMAGNYIVAGSYEKRHNMTVEKGRITDQGQFDSLDNRMNHCTAMGFPNPFPCDGSWIYGCCIAMPLAWALDVGGFEEAMDGAGFEDQMTGMMYHNCGYSIKYDMRMHVVQDRTPAKCVKTMEKQDKGVSPNDKSHRAVEIFKGARNTTNRTLLLQSRQAVQSGNPFPLLFGPREDWFDAMKIDHNYMKP